MDYKTSEVLGFIEENDIKFIRLAVCDIFWNQKNITIMPTELKRAFEEVVSFDASAVTGFMKVEESDLLLIPEDVYKRQDVAFTEDVAKRYEAYGWQVLNIEDGNDRCV